MLPKMIKREPAIGYRNFLILLLVLRIISYFMLSDSLIVVQALKAGIRISLTLIITGTLFFRLRESDDKPVQFHQPTPLMLYVLYLVFGAASLLWTSSFKASFLQWLMDVESFVFAFLFIRLLLIYRRRFPGGYFDIHKILAPSVLIIATGFLIGLYTDPDHFYRLTHGGAVSRLGGFIINPNELGMLLLIGITSFLPLLVKKKKVRISILLSLVFLTYLLLMTGSRSSLIGMFLVMIIFGLTSGSNTQKIFIVSLAVALIPIGAVTIFVKQEQIAEIFTFTGRIPFWQDLLRYNFPKEPWLGYGYMRIDYADKFESINAYSGAMTHNTFMQVLLGLGLAGLFLVLLQLSSFLWTMRQIADRKYRLIISLLFIPIFINSMTEFGIFGETNYGILFYLFLVFTTSTEHLTGSRRIKATTGHENLHGIPYRPAHLT